MNMKNNKIILDDKDIKEKNFEEKLIFKDKSLWIY